MRHLSNKIMAVICFAFLIFVGICVFSVAALNSHVSSIQFTTSGKLTCLAASFNEQNSSKCTIGLKTDGNVYYSLENYPQDFNNKIGSRVQITGVLTLNSDDTYNTSGSINMQTADN